MECVFAHAPAEFAGVDSSRPEFHGLKMPREARGEIFDHLVESPSIQGIRMVRVYAPAQRFLTEPLSIIVVNDGHKAFEAAQVRGHLDAPWLQTGTLQLHRIMDGLLCQGRIRPALVVAIGPRGSSRLNDFMPHQEKVEGVSIGGHGEQYLDFLEHDILPFVTREFGYLGLSTRAEDKAVVGMSMGGFAALFASLMRPHVFGSALALSPSAWVENGVLATMATERKLGQGGRIAIDIGESEAPNNKNYCSQLFAALREHQGHTQILAEVVQGQHHEDSWRERVPRLLEFLLTKTP